MLIRKRKTKAGASHLPPLVSPEDAMGSSDPRVAAAAGLGGVRAGAEGGSGREGAPGRTVGPCTSSGHR